MILYKKLLELLKGAYRDALNSIKVFDSGQIFSEAELVQLILEFNDSDLLTMSEIDTLVIDLFNEELEELFIEKGLHVQKELLQALEISFKALSKSSKIPNMEIIMS